MNSFFSGQIFPFLVFDWDGTAVLDRYASTQELGTVLSALLGLGRTCVMVSGTSIEKIQRPWIDEIPLELRKALFLCMDRGSSVYGFDEKGGLRLLRQRKAKPQELKALDQVVDELAGWLQKKGIAVAVVRDRMNRRKLDLLPVPEWQDPSKAAVLALQGALEVIFARAGFLGGLAEVLRQTQKILSSQIDFVGRVTTDLKNIEIGLTDKADSMRWVFENLITPSGGGDQEVVILGDEFGQLGGISGSDDRLRISEFRKAPCISFGIEPEGVPPGVLHLGGGPEKFLEFLKSQLPRVDSPVDSPVDRLGAFIQASEQGPSYPRLREKMSQNPEWLLQQNHFDPTREREAEAQFALGNGYLGVRGALCLPIPSSQGDCFVSGIYERKASAIPYSEPELMTIGHEKENLSEIVSFPFPFRLSIRTPQGALIPTPQNIVQFERSLCLKSGVSSEKMVLIGNSGENIELLETRVSPLGEEGVLYQEIELKIDSSTHGDFELVLGIEGMDLEVRHPHLQRMGYAVRDPGGAEVHEFETISQRLPVALSSRIWVDGQELRTPYFRVRVGGARRFFLQKVVVLVTGHEAPSPRAEARKRLANLGLKTIARCMEKSLLAWLEYWRTADFDFSHSSELTRALRFGAYHLRIGILKGAALSIGARTLSGRAYEGHVFWDADIFILPRLVHSDPALARACLDYRFQTLSGAMQRAKKRGFSGASFAWESTVTGEDVTPTEVVLKGSGKVVPILTGEQQIHVTADIAYSIWNYLKTTGDRTWMLKKGLRILCETARFWVSRVKQEKQLFHILEVIGPDEYHVSVDDNAYTNWMARFNLLQALEQCEWLRRENLAAWEIFCQQIALSEAELKIWREVGARIYIPAPDQNGVIEQFRGFKDLKVIPLPRSERFNAPVGRLLAWEETRQLQVLKQADVLMIPFLFPGAFSKEILRANYEYYEPRTDHGSSLSPAVHAAIAAQLGNWEQVRFYWNTGLFLDLNNLMNNTALGVHAGNMGATWQALVFHILGMSFAEDGRWHPREDLPPEAWTGVSGQLMSPSGSQFFQIPFSGIRESA